METIKIIPLDIRPTTVVSSHGESGSVSVTITSRASEHFEEEDTTFVSSGHTTPRPTVELPLQSKSPVEKSLDSPEHKDLSHSTHLEHGELGMTVDVGEDSHGSPEIKRTREEEGYPTQLLLYEGVMQEEPLTTFLKRYPYEWCYDEHPTLRQTLGQEISGDTLPVQVLSGEEDLTPLDKQKRTSETDQFEVTTTIEETTDKRGESLGQEELEPSIIHKDLEDAHEPKDSLDTEHVSPERSSEEELTDTRDEFGHSVERGSTHYEVHIEETVEQSPTTRRTLEEESMNR